MDGISCGRKKLWTRNNRGREKGKLWTEEKVVDGHGIDRLPFERDQRDRREPGAQARSASSERARRPDRLGKINTIWAEQPNQLDSSSQFEPISLVSTLLLYTTMRKHELRAPSGEQGRPPRLSTVLIQQLLSVSSTLHEPDSWSGSTSVVECKAPLQQ